MTKINHANIAACYGIGKYDDDDEQNPGELVQRSTTFPSNRETEIVHIMNSNCSQEASS